MLHTGWWRENRQKINPIFNPYSFRKLCKFLYSRHTEMGSGKRNQKGVEKFQTLANANFILNIPSTCNNSNHWARYMGRGTKTCSGVPPGICALTVMPWLASLQDTTSHLLTGICVPGGYNFDLIYFVGFPLVLTIIFCVFHPCVVWLAHVYMFWPVLTHMLLKPWFRLETVVLSLLLVLAMGSVVNSIASCSCPAATIAASHTSLSSQITRHAQSIVIATSAAASGISHSGCSCILCVCVWQMRFLMTTLMRPEAK